MQEGLYAQIKTNKGEIMLILHHDKSPGTVANFINLSEGKIKNSHKPMNVPYYDGLKFHRVIPDFMIQTGCPNGTGTGDPGYKFDDEFHPELRHNKPGILSMANSGVSTNGSQFFITHVATNWLDDKHTVFGEVVEGLDIVNEIQQDDVIDSIIILRVGDEAEKWNSTEVFNNFKDKKEILIKQRQLKEQQIIENLSKDFEVTPSGLRYKILNKGNGDSPTKGDKVKVHYKGMLIDETVFDSSYKRNQPIEFNVGIGQVIPGWDEGIMLLKKGEKAKFIIPSNLGYGEAGAGGVIPSNATLVFEVELL
ncbi:peptidylprolyl isomerase [Flavobacteriaceae bacterium]|jgi:FKBP-type peptidyl-prolyl cis-trans isomerase|nr:peptidylprolyl isomerase [Flavobacteriaceae bacterium]MDA9000107.1 peptidylprolyl isomerase [Flavobacteriaceae bacterium]MDA9177058.1 peptidylprolyl isomerase [Flavobacteriaceae bacterium]MDB0023344.1 peptidylprolyl isomerase [Flavobacteriaceae bacterium]MDB2648381.1 peptidylprolyl isomerase [Flavobacteriaceae bacterium]|tara:strand:+ start:2127 stop:3050 length:924 start_codon:yes stop_codon:yes gene_type:complete